MQHRKKVEFIHPIIVWIIASILFHLLLMLGIIMLRITSMHQTTTPPVKDYAQERAILMMDEPAAPRPVPAQPVVKAVQPPAAKKEAVKPVEPPQTNPNPLNFKIMPGRKGIDKQDIEDIAALKNLPTPDKQTISPEKKAESTPTQPAVEQQDTITEQKQRIKEPQTIIDQDKKTAATQFLTESDKDTAQPAQEKSAPLQKKQDPFEFVPNANRSVSFKDINLGFNKNYTTVGNSSHLIMQGTSFAVPDGVSLQQLTYYNQCARIMQEAIATHRHVRLRSYATSKRFIFDLTIGRQGENLNIFVIARSGDDLLDRIIEESIRSIALFPKVPYFIKQDPFTISWTLLC